MSDFANHNQDHVVPSIETNNTSSGLQNAKASVADNASAAADTVKNHPATQNASAGLQNAANTVATNASAAANAVANHPITQSVTNGPVAQNVKVETQKTTNEFSNLAAARQTPSATAATGQKLTHYHSFFSSLLSWEHPRASGIAYISIVLFIFAARYLDIIRYSFKLTYMVLGITVLAEAVGKAVFATGFTSQIRPKKYYTVSKDTLNSVVGDVHELINFFVIETQQIVFAENIFVSGAAFVGAFLSYYLIKIVPFWGMSLIGTSVLFLAPLIYKTNQQLIDHHLANATNVINRQTVQVKNLASEHAARATETTKSLVGDYSAKAQDMIGNARGTSPAASAKPSKPVKTDSKITHTDSLGLSKENVNTAFESKDFPAAPKANLSSVPTTEFPVAPKTDFTSTAPITKDEPLII